jgi:uncharacterized membrane protein YeaQ/YmgE (transglycosylase-associated protein family)
MRAPRLAAGREVVMEAFIIWLIVGGVAGWLAGVIMKGSGYGLIGDIIIGLIGGVIGGWLWGVLRLPPIGGAWVGPIVTSIVGAVILIFIVRLVRGRL